MEEKQTLEGAISEKFKKGAISEKSKTKNPSKYLTLKILSPLFKILAWVLVIFSFMLLVFPTTEGAIELTTLQSLVGILSGLGLLAFAELIKVFCDIEKNTRKN